MIVTYKPVLKSDPKADGTYSILIRVTAGRISKRVGTGYYIKKKDYNPKGSLDKANWVRATCTLHEVYNTGLKQAIKKAQKQVVEAEKKGVVITAELVQQFLKGKGIGSFLEFYRLYILRYNTDTDQRLHEKYTNVLNKLTDYLAKKKKTDLLFSELTVKFIQGFETWLLTDYRPKDQQGNIRVNGKANNRNTTSKTLSFIKTIIRQAVKAGDMPYTDNPFLNYELKTEKTHKDRLTKEEIQQFAAMEINPAIKAYHARNIFLMQYYCAGSRIGDMLTLQWANIQNDRIQFKMEKTDAQQSLKLPQQALAILQHYPRTKPTDYVFPFLQNGQDLTVNQLEKQVESKTAYINDKLKELFKKLGINKNISTHVARHSFTDQARKSGASLYDISKSLRHSSLKVTENYLEHFDESAVDNVLDNVFGE